MLIWLARLFVLLINNYAFGRCVGFQIYGIVLHKVQYTVLYGSGTSFKNISEEGVQKKFKEVESAKQRKRRRRKIKREKPNDLDTAHSCLIAAV